MKRLLLALMFLFFAASAFAQTAFDFPNTPTANQIVTGPSNQQFQWDGSKWVALLNAGVGGGFTAGGDLSGTSTAQTVIGIQTKTVPAPASGYLHYNGTAFLWDTPAGSGGGAATSVGTTAPASPVIGQLWFNTADLQTYIWYNDTASSHWTAIVNQIGSGTGSGGGGITSITAGTGLTGGTISTSGTIALATPVSIANGGLGTTTAPTTGQIITAQSATAYGPVSLSGDATITSAGALTVTKTNGTAFTALATATVPLSVANGGEGNGTAPTAGQFRVAASATSVPPVTMSGDCTLASSGAVTCTKTNGTAFTALATAAVPLSIANGGTSTGTAPSSGQILIAQSATSYLPETASLDATINPNGQMVVVGIRGNTIPGLVANTYLHYTSGGAFVWDMPGGATVTGPTAFTPTIYFGGASVGVAYSGAQGTYYQVGKLTLITYQIQLSNKGTSTGGAQMCGLPFPAYTSGNHQGDFPVYAASGFTGLTETLVLHLPSGNSCATLVQTTGANQYSGAITDANMTNTSFFYGSFIYEAN